MADVDGDEGDGGPSLRIDLLMSLCIQARLANRRRSCFGGEGVGTVRQCDVRCEIG